jgi:iron complex transport system substrate-binding protein
VRRVAARIAHPRRPRVAFLEWLDPPICGGHWNPELVALAGGKDGIGRAGEPSRTISWDEVADWRPEVLVVACCGYSAARSREDLALLARRADLASLPCFREGRVHVADGKALFSRPGPSLVTSLELLARLLAATP